MEVIVDGIRGIRDDSFNVLLGRFYKVNSRNIRDWFAVFIDKEVEGHTMLAEILHMDQRGQNVLTELVINQYLVNFLICCSICVYRLIQI